MAAARRRRSLLNWCALLEAALPFFVELQETFHVT